MSEKILIVDYLQPPAFSLTTCEFTRFHQIQGVEEKETIYRVYRRYVKQWNDIEMDTDRRLSEHTHEVCGAKVVASAKLHHVTTIQTR